MDRASKGNRVNIPEPETRTLSRSDTGGNATELGDVGESLGKSSLFFLTVNVTLKSVWPAIGFHGRQSCTLLVRSDALSTALENPSELFTFLSGRTHNRSRKQNPEADKDRVEPH